MDPNMEFFLKIAPKALCKKELCPHGKMLGLMARKTMAIENGPKTP